MDGLDHGQDKAIVDLVQMEPLPEHAVGCEIRAHALIEFVGEQPADAADPRVRRFGENQVECPVVRCEVALRIVVLCNSTNSVRASLW